MKIAIVHDYLNQLGGAERCVAAMLEAYPRADLYTSLYFPEDTFEAFRQAEVHTSFMQRLPGIRRHYRKYFPLYPRAFESFDLGGYDVVLSSSSAFAKFAVPGPGTLHICYCYTPMRFAWDFDQYAFKENWPRPLQRLLRPVVEKLRAYDVESLERVHHFLTISEYVRDRILACYGRKAEVIHPPIDTERFFISKDRPEDYYLVVSRLIAHKRVDVAVDAFNRLGRPLKIVGHGPQLKELTQRAKKGIEFFPKIDDARLSELYSRCRALIVPSTEEFGLAPVEAMASGRPVIAFRAGGAVETVIPNESGQGDASRLVTGLFFEEQTGPSLREAVLRFEKLEFDPKAIRSHTMRFDKQVFIERLKASVAERWKRFIESRENNPDSERETKIAAH